MSKIDFLCKHNPLIPWRARPGRGPCVLHYPYDLATAKDILQSISNLDGMVRQCVSCHKFVTGAPHPDVGHQDGPAGPECNLPHHPPPCPWVNDRTGQPCSYIPPSAPSLSSTVSPSVSTAPVTITETPVGGVLSLPEQMAQLRREREEEARRVELLTMANNNLRESQARMSQQLQLQQYSPAVSISSTATTTTSSLSSISRRPSMGIGFSSSFYLQ